jgi:integrase
MRLYKIANKKRTAWGVDLRVKGKGPRYIVGPKTEALAELARIAAGEKTVSFSRDSEWGKFKDRYFSYATSSMRPETVKQDIIRLKAFEAFMVERGINRLLEIRPGFMQEFQAIYIPGHSRKSWNNLLGVIKTMLNRAVEWEVIEFNPVARLRPLQLDRGFHYFLKEELAEIQAEAKGHLKTAIDILVNTGMRRGELYNQRWRDVNLKVSRIIIKPYSGFSTKSRLSRQVPIPEPLAPILAGLRDETRPKPDDPMFRPYKSIFTLREQFVGLLGRLGMEGTLHDLRHTYGANLAAAGYPIPLIQRWMGHSDISTTMIYSTLAPDTLPPAGLVWPFA